MFSALEKGMGSVTSINSVYVYNFQRSKEGLTLARFTA